MWSEVSQGNVITPDRILEEFAENGASKYLIFHQILLEPSNEV
jgi:hypothetical protein